MGSRDAAKGEGGASKPPLLEKPLRKHRIRTRPSPPPPAQPVRPERIRTLPRPWDLQNL